jgi:hypothetical protein
MARALPAEKSRIPAAPRHGLQARLKAAKPSGRDFRSLNATFTLGREL